MKLDKVACKSLKVLQNNIQSVRPTQTREELYYYLKQNEIAIVLLQEIWLKKEEQFRMANYRMESYRRNAGYGGVAVLVREDIYYETVDIGCFLPVEVVAIKISKQFAPITFTSVYAPPDRHMTNEVKEKIRLLFDAIEDLQGEIVVGGDWNGHHETWDPSRQACPKGKLINSLIEKSKLTLLNDGTHTCLTTTNGESSTVDLTLATPGTAVKTQWNVDEQDFGSIHLAILLEIGSNIPVVKKTTKKINQDKIVAQINSIQPQYMYDPFEMQQIFDECIENASYVFKNKKANWLKKWWTDEINIAYQAKRQALRNYNRTKNLQNHLNLQKTRATLKRLIRKTKRNYCQELTEKVDENTPSKQLWNIVRGLDTALTKPGEYKPEINVEDGSKFMEHYILQRKIRSSSYAENKYKARTKRIRNGYSRRRDPEKPRKKKDTLSTWTGWDVLCDPKTTQARHPRKNL